MDGVASASAQPKSAKPPPPRRRLTRAICITVWIVLLLVVVIMVILALTVFKARNPVVTVGSVSLRDLDFSLSSALRVAINASIDVGISVKNPNQVGFRYDNASALLYYDGGLVGEAPIPSGRIGAGKSIAMNLTLAVMADRLLTNSKLYSDVLAGSLPLTTSTRISGKVPVLLVKVKVVSYSTCNITVDITNRTLKDSVCKYRTRL